LIRDSLEINLVRANKDKDLKEQMIHPKISKEALNNRVKEEENKNLIKKMMSM
jgi:hypothetical protein